MLLPDDQVNTFMLSCNGKLINASRAQCTYVYRERFEGMKHVKSVKIYNTSGHSVVAEAHLFAHINDKQGTFFPVLTFGFVINPILDGWRIKELLFVIIPARHFSLGCGLNLTSWTPKLSLSCSCYMYNKYHR